jgi:hypothetical protein
MTNPKRPPPYDASYTVGAATVFLSVTVGEAQSGNTRVTLDGNELANGAVKHLEIGTGANLAGKKLALKSTVSALNQMSKHTSVTLVLEGGTTGLEHTMEVDLDDYGDTAIYRAEVTFA